MRKLYPLFVFLVLGPASSSFAQSFNIDFGALSGNRPPATYGAVPQQNGSWNLVSGFQNTALLNLDGTSSPVRIDTGQTASGTVDIPGLTGGEEAFMESIITGLPAVICSITNLTTGTYDVYLYAWRPPGFMTTKFDQVGVFNGVTGGDTVLQASRSWPGVQIEGETYGKFTVDVLAGGPTPGTLQLFSQGFGEDAGILNGIQLVRVPAPISALPLLGLSFALLSRRR